MEISVCHILCGSGFTSLDAVSCLSMWFRQYSKALSQA